MWTMEQLVERVSVALAAEYPGAPNGRVRELPDRRSIRWYTTIGLVDRPLGTRGRTALYGSRHLLQLVAIKRRQAAGLTLAEIQAELAGASEETLTTVARVPDGLLETDTPPADHTARAHFWKSSPAPPGPFTPATAGSPQPAAADVAAASPAAQRIDADSTTETIVEHGPAGLRVGTDPTPPSTTGTTRKALAAAIAALDESGPPHPGLMTGVPLGGGVVLLLPHHITDLNRDELAAAARPLLDMLASRGLTDGRNA